MLRDNLVHDMFEEEMGKLGDAGNYVSREYLYRKVGERAGLSVRSVSYILNHTDKMDIERG